MFILMQNILNLVPPLENSMIPIAILYIPAYDIVSKKATNTVPQIMQHFDHSQFEDVIFTLANFYTSFY